MSRLEDLRREYQPKIPPILQQLDSICATPIDDKREIQQELKSLFPHTYSMPSYRIEKKRNIKEISLKIGVFFSGGQAAGGHNVLAGLFDAIGKGSLVGFLNGPAGLIEDQSIVLTDELIGKVRNQGGFDLIGSSRIKIETSDQMLAALETVRRHQLNALVVIGGDDSNTNGAILAEYFAACKQPTQVIGVPKTIDGDLRSEDIEMSFGFDSACKTYSEIIGNIARDAKSAQKYYHFIKVMGRSASHIALECALSTHPNLTLIGEEGRGLNEIVREVAELIVERHKRGRDYGVVVIPEGLVEFIPEIRELIQELNRLLGADEVHAEEMKKLKPAEQIAYISPFLSTPRRETFLQLLDKIQKQLLLERDPHGNVQVSKIETEQLLMDLVKKELKSRGFKGKFSAQEHFLGYEGRACFPTNFDADYAYTLGRSAALAAREGLTGVICAVSNMAAGVDRWEVRFIPIVRLMRFEVRRGKSKPVIEKKVVDLNSSSYVHFSLNRKSWAFEDQYQYPGPIQFFGDPKLTDSAPQTLLI